MKNLLLSGAALLLAAGMLQAQPFNTSATAPVTGKMLPRFDQMTIEQPVALRAPMREIGDEIAHWPLNTFSEFETFAAMTIIDVNGDDVSWSAGSTGTNLNVMCRSNASENNDDWLITTPVTLEAGKRYQVSVQLRGRYAENRTIEIKAGNENTAEAMTIGVVEQQTVPTDAYHMFKGAFLAETSGDYYIGFHDISPAAAGAYIYLADIIITEAAAPGAAAAVEDLTVTPGVNAALTATVKFTVPTLNLMGEELTSIDHMDLLCNGEVVKTWNEVEPGQPVRYLDRPAVGGSKTYAVAIYNEAGRGELAEATVWVGYDIPSEISNVLLSTDTNGQLQLAWDVPTKGYNGYIFDPEQVWFNVYSVTTTNHGSSTLGDVIYTTETGVTSHQLGQGIDEGDQRGMNCWAVSAVNESGEGPFRGSNYLLTGAPYTLPFEDDFADGEAKTFWTASGSGLGYEYGYAGTGVRYFNEGGATGALFMNTFVGDTVQGHSFKISLKDSKLPKLKFKRSTEGGPLKVLVIVYNADHNHFATVFEETVEETTGIEEFEVSLEEFKDEPRYIQIAFTAIDPEEMAYEWKYLNVTDVVVYDAGKSAIEDIAADRKADTTVYTIDGRTLGNSLDNLPRGIYIQGGKKILK